MKRWGVPDKIEIVRRSFKALHSVFEAAAASLPLERLAGDLAVLPSDCVTTMPHAARMASTAAAS